MIGFSLPVVTFGAFSIETSRFLQAVIEGISLAGIYTLIAIGFVIIYKSTQVLSFAQPALLIMGAYLASYVSITLGFGFWVGIAVAVLLSGFVGYLTERAVLRPMVGKPVFAVAILTIGLDIAIRVIVGDLIGVNIRAIGTSTSEGFGAPSLPWGSTPLRFGDLAGVGGVVIQPRVLASFSPRPLQSLLWSSSSTGRGGALQCEDHRSIRKSPLPKV
jgi:ABC-type branched-subunit amino acid transport system permease subunit